MEVVGPLVPMPPRAPGVVDPLAVVVAHVAVVGDEPSGERRRVDDDRHHDERGQPARESCSAALREDAALAGAAPGPDVPGDRDGAEGDDDVQAGPLGREGRRRNRPASHCQGRQKPSLSPSASRSRAQSRSRTSAAMAATIQKNRKMSSSPVRDCTSSMPSSAMSIPAKQPMQRAAEHAPGSRAR